MSAALTSTAQLLLSTTRGRQTHERRRKLACAFGFRGMTVTITPPLERKKKDGVKGVHVRACVFLKIKMYICQSWEASDIKCQRSRWNTDKSHFSPFIFLNRFCFAFFFYFNIQGLHKETKKKKKYFLFNQTKWERLCVNLEILVLQDGSRNYKKDLIRGN